ncbi:MAG: D-aminoacyl-tRNA deacylase [Marinifilaceae bacterium]|jgi:D-tyrosyl-tRNA(Tyr) deacylase|nr:D-aminoacyl-tRNA deacylase [Marinifilaceae bacterium]
MKIVIQRVNFADININKTEKRQISKGLLVLLGIVNEDGLEDIEWLIKKILNLRIFDDQDGVMNKSIQDIEGDILVVSQFTLHAKTKKGNRPSYIAAAKPDIAIPLYNEFIVKLKSSYNAGRIETGEFGADMDIKFENSGPVTIIIDSKNKE